MISKKKSDKTTSTEKLLGVIRSKSPQIDNGSQNQPSSQSEPQPSVEKRLEEGAKERQTIMGKAGNLDHPDNTAHYNEALKFIFGAGVLKDEEFRRLAVRHGATLMEMLAGAPEVMQFFSDKRLDYASIATNIRDILHGLHFNSDNDYYLSLLLPPNADVFLINRRWKELMRIYHPDHNGGGLILSEDYAAESTKRLNEVYNVLKDPREKFKYDQQSGGRGKQRRERPSFFTKRDSKATIFSGHRRHFLAVAVIVLVLAAAASTLYLRVPVRHPDASSGIQRLENKAPDAVVPPNEHAESRVSTSHALPGRKVHIARNLGDSSGRKQDVVLAEDVYGFISRLELAFEHGDLESYLSCYSASATENSMNYGRIREYYKNLFKKGHSRLSMGNMIISQERDGIKVRGLFAVEMPPNGGGGKAPRGSFTIRLKREHGRLKILDFRRVENKLANLSVLYSFI